MDQNGTVHSDSFVVEVIEIIHFLCVFRNFNS